MIKICTVCGKEYENRDKRSVHCGNVDCKNKIMRERYKEKIHNKKCEKCGNAFIGTQKQIICKECRTKKRKCIYKKINVNILCPKCKTIMRTVLRNNTRGKVNVIGSTVCKKCKKISRQKQSEKMKQNNPRQNENFNPGWMERKLKRENHVVMSSEEFSKLMSEKMKQNNPMHRLEVREKVSKTLVEGYKSGRIKKIIGENNRLWKGNRYIGQVIRARLISWIRLVMERDNFTCMRCGAIGGRLEVHHIEPLKDIIKKFFEKHGFDTNNSPFGGIDKNSDAFILICGDILDYHLNNMDIGITYCSKCHSEIDEKRYYKKGVYYESGKNHKKTL